MWWCAQQTNKRSSEWQQPVPSGGFLSPYGGGHWQLRPVHSLAGGVILEMSKLTQVIWAKPGLARVQAGIKLAAIDKHTREMGWEIRMAPSTYRTATIGGFIAGGSGGIGSVTYGQLLDRGNILGLRVVTVEEEPRILELRGDDVFKVSHAWGLTGIITEVEIPLAPAYPWAELIVAFPPEGGLCPAPGLARLWPLPMAS